MKTVAGKGGEIKSTVFVWVFWRKITKVRVSCETFVKKSAGAPAGHGPGGTPGAGQNISRERRRPAGAPAGHGPGGSPGEPWRGTGVEAEAEAEEEEEEEEEGRTEEDGSKQ